MATVTRRDRLVDLAALLLIVAGTALYLYGTVRLKEIAQLTWRHPGPLGVKQLDAADRARYACNGGMALVVVGAVVGVWSAVRVKLRRAD